MREKVIPLVNYLKPKKKQAKSKIDSTSKLITSIINDVSLF